MRCARMPIPPLLPSPPSPPHPAPKKIISNLFVVGLSRVAYTLHDPFDAEIEDLSVARPTRPPVLSARHAPSTAPRPSDPCSLPCDGRPPAT